MFFNLPEQDIDGDTLQMLLACGTMEQLCACGLKTIKDQMKLRKLFANLKSDCQGSPAGLSTPTSTLSLSGSSSSSSPRGDVGDRKLSLKQLKALSPEEKQLYLIK